MCVPWGKGGQLGREVRNKWKVGKVQVPEGASLLEGWVVPTSLWRCYRWLVGGELAGGRERRWAATLMKQLSADWNQVSNGSGKQKVQKEKDSADRAAEWTRREKGRMNVVRLCWVDAQRERAWREWVLELGLRTSSCRPISRHCPVGSKPTPWRPLFLKRPRSHPAFGACSFRSKNVFQHLGPPGHHPLKGASLSGGMAVDLLNRYAGPASGIRQRAQTPAPWAHVPVAAENRQNPSAPGTFWGWPSSICIQSISTGLFTYHSLGLLGTWHKRLPRKHLTTYELGHCYPRNKHFTQLGDQDSQRLRD